jgi:hypothetical protein
MSDQVITLVKYKTHYMPRTGEDYARMRKLRMPVTRLHHSALGILKHQADKNGIALKGVSWNSVLNEATSKVESYWAGEHFKSEFTRGRMLVSTTHSSVLESARSKATNVQGAIERFMNRWGFSGQFNYSESRDKVQLVVDYEFNAARTPAIDVGQNPEDAPSYTFTAGFTRWVFTQTGKYLIWKMQTQTGQEWREVTSGRSLLNTVSDPSEMIGGLLNLPQVKL